jgi:hypothetical protein
MRLHLNSHGKGMKISILTNILLIPPSNPCMTMVHEEAMVRNLKRNFKVNSYEKNLNYLHLKHKKQKYYKATKVSLARQNLIPPIKVNIDARNHDRVINNPPTHYTKTYRFGNGEVRIKGGRSQIGNTCPDGSCLFINNDN